MTLAELIRIRGVGREYANLLEAAGVHSIRELSLQDPTALSDALLEVNLLRNLVKAAPSEKQAAGWVRQAQGFLLGH